MSESIYKGISPGGVDASLQWRESKGGGGELVHSSCSKHPTSSKNPASIGSAPNSSVLYLFIWVGGQMYVQWRWISVTGRIKERHHK